MLFTWKDMDLFARKFDCPALFPGHLPITGYLPMPRSIDSLVNLRDFALAGDAITGWTFVLKNA